MVGKFQGLLDRRSAPNSLPERPADSPAECEFQSSITFPAKCQIIGFRDPEVGRPVRFQLSLAVGLCKMKERDAENTSYLETDAADHETP